MPDKKQLSVLFATVASILAVAMAVATARHLSDKASEQSLQKATQTPCTAERMRALIADLDKDVVFHADISPAGEDLIDCGPPAIPFLLEVIERDDNEPDTRMIASRAARLIAIRYHGWELHADSEKNKPMKSWFNAHGRLHYDAPVEQRRKEAELWRKWVSATFPALR